MSTQGISKSILFSLQHFKFQHILEQETCLSFQASLHSFVAAKEIFKDTFCS